MGVYSVSKWETQHLKVQTNIYSLSYIYLIVLPKYSYPFVYLFSTVITVIEVVIHKCALGSHNSAVTLFTIKF